MQWLTDLVAMYAVKEPSFLWPTMLYLLVIVPLLVLLYVWLLSRRKKQSRLYASLATTEVTTGKKGKTSAWRRHGPPLLLLMGLTVLILAIARPQAIIMLPS